ncbi:TRAFAC clade GTPase domain-containing protein [Hyphococcus sp.]|uniref:TRAFAC clade GTPase domain-containing protein n=1 Tax=Hyphococcus sp. TaxID=2038636 RepID=UPI003D0A2F3B
MTGGASSSLVVCGLPSSGKTTFLAALWHLVQSGEVSTELKLNGLTFGDYEYVNTIRKRWLEGKRQPRTVGVARTIGIDLTHEAGVSLQLLFPDHSGETFDRLWATRDCDQTIADHLSTRSGTLLFLRPESMKSPLPLADMLATEAEMMAALPAGDATAAPTGPVKAWSADDSPDQVKIVDILQTLAHSLPTAGNDKLAIFVSAWDVVEDAKSPAEFVKRRMPLLDQYLRRSDHGFNYRFYGVSAQGGEYVEESHVGNLPDHLKGLLELEKASARIKLVSGASVSHDLTAPLVWLIS